MINDSFDDNDEYCVNLLWGYALTVINYKSCID